MSTAKKNRPQAAARAQLLATLEARAASAPAAESHLFWEERVAENLGLSRERVRELRAQHLTSPEHFVAGPANAICLTPAGLDRLRALTGPGGAAGQAPEAPPAPPGPPERAEFVVHKIPGNARLLVCRRTVADTATLIVRVRTNENFMPGMRVPVIQAGENLWQHYGRLPRRKGRW